MLCTPTAHRLRALSSLVIALGLGMLGSGIALAAQDDVAIELIPHCAITEGNTSGGVFGSVPDIPYLIELGDGRCPSFPTKDPLTRETPILDQNELLDMDLVIRNPKKLPIRRFRAWMAYDPTVLAGDSIEITDAFSVPTPGEQNFSESDGFIQIGAESRNARTASMIIAARIKVRPSRLPGTNTVISFYDTTGTAQSHTAVITGTDASEQNVLAPTLGSLLVRLKATAGSAFSRATNTNTGTQSSQAPTSDTTTSQGTSHSNMPEGAASSAGMGDVQSSEVASTPALPTVFTLLQIQNLRVTTEGTSAYLAWDALPSAELAGYNVYYGTVSGRYIQRRSVDGASTTLAIRNLPEGVTYYFAVRGVNRQNQETEFSQEVAVTIGNPATSTSPLTGSVMGPGGRPPKTNGGIQGETGISSPLLLLLLSCAVIGTLLAFRRQFTAAAQPSRA